MFDEFSKQRVKHLCDLIAKEQDHHRFSLLVAELNELLDGFDPAKKREVEDDPSSPFGKPS
jgi:hypothetical protein